MNIITELGNIEICPPQATFRRKVNQRSYPVLFSEIILFPENETLPGIIYTFYYDDCSLEWSLQDNSYVSSTDCSTWPICTDGKDWTSFFEVQRIVTETVKWLDIEFDWAEFWEKHRKNS